MADELPEITEKQTLSREAAAARLRALADQLARHNQVEFLREGVRYTAKVPAQGDRTGSAAGRPCPPRLASRVGQGYSGDGGRYGRMAEPVLARSGRTAASGSRMSSR